MRTFSLLACLYECVPMKLREARRRRRNGCYVEEKCKTGSRGAGTVRVVSGNRDAAGSGCQSTLTAATERPSPGTGHRWTSWARAYAGASAADADQGTATDAGADGSGEGHSGGYEAEDGGAAGSEHRRAAGKTGEDDEYSTGLAGRDSRDSDRRAEDQIRCDAVQDAAEKGEPGQWAWRTASSSYRGGSADSSAGSSTDLSRADDVSTKKGRGIYFPATLPVAWCMSRCVGYGYNGEQRLMRSALLIRDTAGEVFTRRGLGLSTKSEGI